jgi:aldehyde dehydrogenase (NAD(P)+)
MTTLSSGTALDERLQRLHAAAPKWVELAIPAKIKLLKRVREGVHEQAEGWATAAAKAKGLTGTPLAGEEWISGPWAVLYALNRYISTLDEIDKHGVPQIAQSRRHTRGDGQLVVDVFPNSVYDRLLLNGVRAEVWMQPGVTAASLDDTMAVWYKSKNHAPKVSLVLGAGNIAAIAPLDALYKLIADGSVCILKMNPVNEYIGPFIDRAFAPLIECDYLAVVYGGGDVGKALCENPLVDDIHITGSDKTHDRIAYGDGPDAAERKRNNDRVLDKPITSELGNVSPTIVVPGPWSDADFRFQAENIVTQKMHNGGFNCIASQVVILPSAWDGTPKLIAQIENVLRDIIDRPAYYPGAVQRHELLNAPGAQTFGKSGDGFIPRTLVRVEAHSKSQNFMVEAFAPLLTVTTLDGDTQAFLRTAVDFANEEMWGSLGGNIIVHPATMREFAPELDKAIANLRYGCVGVNAWTGVGFLLTETTWGAFPGNAINDVRSGIGVVHNSFLFDKAQKSVVYAPFAPFPRSVAGYGATMLPKPPWFVTHAQADKAGRALVEFEYAPSPLRATTVAMHAMRG